jgi:hypothetical protein
VAIAMTAIFLGLATIGTVIGASSPAGSVSVRTENVILITIDGVRIQELFGGMDGVIAGKPKHSGISDLERTRKLYWRDTPERRREALWPFFWGTLARDGIVLGNKEKGSRVLVKNPLLFSGPGYAEILTGQPQDDVISNDLIRYPHQTVLEYAQRKLGLNETQVAMVGSWEGFKLLASAEPDVFFTNGGHDEVPPHLTTQRMAFLGELQSRVMILSEEERSDGLTFAMALEYLKTHEPRLLYIALGEPDAWSHARRYDRLLDYLHMADGYLRDLWQVVESSNVYGDRTTIIITTDHGRGIRPSDWVSHGEGVKGAEDTWIAVIGPDTPDRGEVKDHPTVYQADVAATLLQFFDLDYRDFNPQAGPPIPGSFAPSPAGTAARE